MAPHNYQMARQTAVARKAFFSLDFPFFAAGPTNLQLCLSSSSFEKRLALLRRRLGATSVEAAYLANFSFASAGAWRVWPSQVLWCRCWFYLVPPARARLHWSSTVQSGSTLLLAAVSLAPSPPHQSSSPALLAAIAKPRAGIRIQLDAWP